MNKELNIGFSVEIPENSKVVRETVRCEAGRFPWDYLQTNPQRVIDQKLGQLFKDLQNGRFWGVIRMIDGSYNEFVPEHPQEREKARKWAKEKFTPYELKKILKICIGTALTNPYGSTSPGAHKGHSILYQELVEKSDSMFKEDVDEDFRKRLINGRLWEEIPYMMSALNGGISYKRVENILINHFDELDVGFIPQGYKIFQRNGGENNNFDLTNLSDEGINMYGQFLIHAKFNLTHEQSGHLAIPYLNVLGKAP